jgi:hypothetical protein
MQLTIEQFKTQLAMFLRDMPKGTTADLTEFAVAYWDGQQVVYAFLSPDRAGEIEEEFDLDDYVWAEWHDQFAAWVAEPVMSVRPEVERWLKDAPPHEAA